MAPPHPQAACGAKAEARGHCVSDPPPLRAAILNPIRIGECKFPMSFLRRKVFLIPMLPSQIEAQTPSSCACRLFKPSVTPVSYCSRTGAGIVTYEKLLAIKMAQEATLLDYLHEVEHGTARIARLDSAITEAVKSAPPQMRAVIEALQALRGIAHVSAVTVVAELGELSRFARARQLMAYGGIVPSEDSSGERTRRGNITKTGNAHLRRVVVEAAWAYRHRPSVGAKLRKRQAHVSEEVKEISWKAQQRLHQRYRKLLAKGKNKGVVMTAVGRELLGFIWAIGIKAETAQREPLQRVA